MITGTTESGFSFELEEEILDDYEFVEAIGETEDNPFAVNKVVKLLLGKKGASDLKEHCRDENGRVRTSRIEKEIVDILNNAGKSKN